jgi:hypothetical protein
MRSACVACSLDANSRQIAPADIGAIPNLRSFRELRRSLMELHRPSKHVGFRTDMNPPGQYNTPAMSRPRGHIREPVGIVKFVTSHALERWMERTGCDAPPRALASLVKHLERADEVELAPRYRATALLNHKLEPARYLRCDGWVFVVSLDGGLITIHTGGAKRWIPRGMKQQRPKRSPPK